MTVTLLVGDVFEKLRDIPSDSVDCVCTSPPYWGLRKYIDDDAPEKKFEIGLEPTLGEHLDVMVRLFREIRRVLKPTGTLWLNYGDCYATSPNGRSAADTKATGNDDRTFRDKPFSTVGPIHPPGPGNPFPDVGRRGGGNNPSGPVYDPSWATPRGKFTSQERSTRHDNGGRVVAGGYLKPKDLCMVPNRLAIALQEDGWFVRSEIIWAKPNPMPESISDRPATAHEKIFLLTKSGSTSIWRARDTGEWSHAPDHSERLPAPTEEDPNRTVNRWRGCDYRYDPGAVRQGRTSDEDANTFRGGSYTGGEPAPRLVTGNKRVGRAKADSFAREHKATAGDHGQKPQHRPDREEVSYPRGEGRNLRNYEPPPMQVWKISTQPFSEAHFATFPPELVERCLQASAAPRGGMVLDPFGGAGTTGLVAGRLGLDCTLIELNPDYAKITRKRLRAGLVPVDAEGDDHDDAGPLFAGAAA